MSLSVTFIFQDFEDSRVGFGQGFLAKDTLCMYARMEASLLGGSFVFQALSVARQAGGVFSERLKHRVEVARKP